MFILIRLNMVWLNGWLIGLIQAFIKRSHQECTAVIGVGNNIIYFMSGVSLTLPIMNVGRISRKRHPTMLVLVITGAGFALCWVAFGVGMLPNLWCFTNVGWRGFAT